MAGRGGLRALRERFVMHECMRLEPWPGGPELPAVVDSSRSRRTGPTGHQPLLIRGQRAVSGREDP